MSSGTWDIIACPGNNTVDIGGDGYRHAWITFTLKIRRKTLFYTVNLIIPCVLISSQDFLCLVDCRGLGLTVRMLCLAAVCNVRVFPIFGANRPKWNELSTDISSAASLSVVSQRLRTFLFRISNPNLLSTRYTLLAWSQK